MGICLCQSHLDGSAVHRCSCPQPWKEQAAPANMGPARPGSICTHGIQKSLGKLEDYFPSLENICFNVSPSQVISILFTLAHACPAHHRSQGVCKLCSGYWFRNSWLILLPLLPPHSLKLQSCTSLLLKAPPAQGH